MNFYSIWEAVLKDNIDDSTFIESFLKKTNSSRDVLLNGTEDEMLQIFNFLNKYDIDKMIDKIDSSYLSVIDPNMVIQFSSFEIGIKDVISILKQFGNLTFDEIGKYLLGERDLLAMKKYGENHSKLAQIFDLVELSNKKPITVSLTSLGRFCSMMDFRSEQRMLRILALRDPLIRNIIYRSKTGKCKYISETSCLSESTQIRRRSNVKTLIDFILTNSNYEYLLENIEW